MCGCWKLTDAGLAQLSAPGGVYCKAYIFRRVGFVHCVSVLAFEYIRDFCPELISSVLKPKPHPSSDPFRDF